MQITQAALGNDATDRPGKRSRHSVVPELTTMANCLVADGPSQGGPHRMNRSLRATQEAEENIRRRIEELKDGLQEVKSMNKRIGKLETIEDLIMQIRGNQDWVIHR